MNSEPKPNETERRLLAGVNHGLKRNDNILTAAERRGLEEIRRMIEALKEKYPSQTFRYESFSLPFGLDSRSVLTFRQEGGKELFRAELSRENGDIICRDNFFGKLAEKDACSAVSRVLRAEVQVSFRPMTGNEVDERVTFEELLYRGMPYCPNYRVTLPAVRIASLDMEGMRKQLTCRGLWGFYQIYIRLSPEETLYCGAIPADRRKKEA